MDGQKKRLSLKRKRQIRNLVLFSIVIIAVAAIFLAIVWGVVHELRAITKSMRENDGDGVDFGSTVAWLFMIRTANHQALKFGVCRPNFSRFKLRTLLSAQKKQIAQSSIIEKAILVFCFERICREFVDLISPFLYHNNIDSPSGNLFVVFVA